MNDELLSKLKSIEVLLKMLGKDVYDLNRRIDTWKIFEKEVLNSKEAAQFLDISQSNLYKLTSNKEIPYYCPHGKKIYFDRQELIDWIKENSQK